MEHTLIIPIVSFALFFPNNFLTHRKCCMQWLINERQNGSSVDFNNLIAPVGLAFLFANFQTIVRPHQGRIQFLNHIFQTFFVR